MRSFPQIFRAGTKRGTKSGTSDTHNSATSDPARATRRIRNEAITKETK